MSNRIPHTPAVAPRDQPAPDDGPVLARSPERAHGGRTETDRHGGIGTAGRQTAALARTIVQHLSAAAGRGPTSARAHFTEDAVTVILRNTLTRMEQTLIEGGCASTVAEGRVALHRVLEPKLTAEVETITKRSVLSAHVDHRVEVDVAVLTFVLDPELADAPTG